MAASSRTTLSFWLLVGLIASVGCAKTVLSDTLDPDLFWHLRVAQQLRADGIGPIVDNLSYNSIKQPWTPYSWLAELLMEWSWRRLGWGSAIAVEVVMTVLIVVLIAQCCRELAGRGRRLSCGLATAVGAFFTIPYLAFRPVTFAIGVLGVVAWLLLRDRRLGERSRAVWLVVPLTALCTNLHLAAVVAPAWVACLVAGAVWERRSVGRYGALLAATSLACLATPMLPGAVRTGFHYLGSDVMVAAGGIAELQRPSAATLTVAGVIGVVAVINRRRLRVGEWLWLLVAAGMMLRMARFAPMFAFIAAPALAATMPRLPDRVLGLLAVRGALAAALLASLLRIAIESPRPTSLDEWLNRRGPKYPTAGAAYVEAHLPPRSGRLINEFNWGGYLAWRLGGKYQVFVDGRTQLYDGQFWRTTYLGSDAELAAAIEAARADVAIIPMRNSRFRPALERLGWRTYAVGDDAEILVPPDR